MPKRPANIVAYEQRRGEIRGRVDEMGHGTRSRISKDLRISPTTIGGVINGYLVDEPLLDRIEAWLSDHDPEQVKQGSDGEPADRCP